MQLLLSSYDDKLAESALECLSSLAVPPMFHRCLDLVKHSTLLHKNTTFSIPIFEIVDAGYKLLNNRVDVFIKGVADSNNTTTRTTNTNSESDYFEFVSCNRRSYTQVGAVPETVPDDIDQVSGLSLFNTKYTY